MSVAELGNGSWIIGILFIVFGLIGLLNAFAAFMMWLKAFLQLLNKKAKTRIVFWFVIIVVTLGWYAMFELVKIL